MSVEFRQRTPGEYARLLWRRKWLIVFPTIAISIAVAAVVARLPNVYQSTTLLAVKPASIPSMIAPKLSEADMTLRLNSIAQEVLSRSALEPLITSFDLYPKERAAGVPMEALVERMRRADLSIELNRSNEAVTNGFYLSFRAATPGQAQKVAEQLAAKFTSAQISAVTKETDASQKLIDSELARTKQELDDLDRQREEYQRAHEKTLPQSQGSALGMLQGLYSQQQALINELGRMRDQKTFMSNQLADAQKRLETAKDAAEEDVTDPHTTPNWANLDARQIDLETELEAMKGKLKPANPDVIAVQQKINAIKRQKDVLLDQYKEKVAARKRRLEEQAKNDPNIKQLEYNLKYFDNEMERQQKALDQTRTAIAQQEELLNSVPGTQIGIEQLERDYGIKMRTYQDLLQKQQVVKLSNQVNLDAQGESFQVLDPASLPEQPIAPKRGRLMALGVVAGLGFGLLFAVAFEVPHLLTIQTVEDARHYTNLPVLAFVPEMLTPQEQRRAKFRRVLLSFASVAVTVVSVPLLIIVLRLSHVLEMFA